MELWYFTLGSVLIWKGTISQNCKYFQLKYSFLDSMGIFLGCSYSLAVFSPLRMLWSMLTKDIKWRHPMDVPLKFIKLWARYVSFADEHISLLVCIVFNIQFLMKTLSLIRLGILIQRRGQILKMWRLNWFCFKTPLHRMSVQELLLF